MVDPTRPYRDDFDSEVSFLNACLAWLDYQYPARVDQRRKVAAWLDLDAEADPIRVNARLGELIKLDRDFTDDEAAEFERLLAQRRAYRRTGRKIK